MGESAVRLTVTDDLARSRATTFFRGLLAIPHLIVLSLAATLAIPLIVIQWLVALVTGGPSVAIAKFLASLVRYAVHVYAYLTLAASPWPPFLGAEAYPVDVDVQTDERQGRWGVLFRLVLAAPALAIVNSVGTGTLSGTAWSWVGFGVFGAIWATLAPLAWVACLIRGRMPAGMRDLAVHLIGYGARASAYTMLLTARYPSSDPALTPIAATDLHPVRLRMDTDDLARTRMVVFFRMLLVTPHAIWLTLWGLACAIATPIAWLCALIAGRVPRPLHRFLAAYVRYGTHVGLFVTLAANPFPGFTGAPRRYPLDLVVPTAPERQRRWTVLLRAPLALPAMVLLGLLWSVAGLLWLYAWWVAMVLGRIPRGMRNSLAYTLRYGAQLQAYLTLVTGRYPFSGPDAEGL